MMIPLFGRPPTTEEAIAARKKDEERWKAALPLDRETRAKLRELAAMGFDTRRVQRCRREMALQEDEIEMLLARDPSLDLPEPTTKTEEPKS